MPLPASIPLPGGLALPAVGLGTFKARGADVQSAVVAALECGYRHIDTASIYKNEADIAAGIAASGVPRSQLFITSKVSPYQQGTEAATAACLASLAALGGAASDTPGTLADGDSSSNCGNAGSSSSGSAGKSESIAASGSGRSSSGSSSSPYIDLVLVHWPGAAKQAADSPVNAELRRQTWRVLEGLHRRGAFRSIGVSNYTVRHLEELAGYAEVAPAVNQVEVHPRFQQRELRAYCASRGIAVVAYASLGSGQLLQDPAVQAAAAAAGVTPAQALLLWGLRRGCAVIPKSVDKERIGEAAPARLAAAERQLSDGPALGALLEALDGLEEREGTTKYCWDPSNIL